MKTRQKNRQFHLFSSNQARIFLMVWMLIIVATNIQAQVNMDRINGSSMNAISTAVPFVTIAPDGRSSGMGDVGVATSPDVNSQHWNPAKYPFAEPKGGIAFNYATWLKNLGIDNINLSYLVGYFKPDSVSAISSSFRYFSLGEYVFTSNNGVILDRVKPFEFTLDAGYSRKLTKHLSAGILARYIFSNLTKSSPYAPDDTYPGTSIAADFGVYYQDLFFLEDHKVRYAAGLNISNMGTPLSYHDDQRKNPIPSNLRLGGSIEYFFDHAHSISLNADLNKLMVPTPGLYTTDSITGNQILLYGRGEPSSIFEGIYSSFYDAPGYLLEDGSRSVLLEELHEVMIGAGIEYGFYDLFKVRAGYFHEHATKGNRKYFSCGAGLHIDIFAIDFSYLFPVMDDSPLENTYRIMLSIDFGRPRGNFLPADLFND